MVFCCLACLEFPVFIMEVKVGSTGEKCNGDNTLRPAIEKPGNIMNLEIG